MNGHYSIPSVVGGSISLQATATGFTTLTIPIQLNSDTRQDFRLTASTRLGAEKVE